MTDTELLRRVIAKSGLKYQFLAAYIGITPYGLQKKIENESEFKASEIDRLSSALKLSNAMRDKIFFARKMNDIHGCA